MSSDGPLFGSGGFFGRTAGPNGPYGAWPGCGCGSLIIVLGGMLLVCGGVLSWLETLMRH